MIGARRLEVRGGPCKMQTCHKNSRAQLSGFNILSNSKFCMSPQDKSSRQLRAQLSGFNIPSSSACHLRTKVQGSQGLSYLVLTVRQLSFACHLRTKAQGSQGLSYLVLTFCQLSSACYLRTKTQGLSYLVLTFHQLKVLHVT